MTVATQKGMIDASSAGATISKETAQARKLAASPPLDTLALAKTMTYNAVAAYWDEMGTGSREADGHPLRPLPACITLVNIPPEALDATQAVGRKAAELGISEASYAIGALYTRTMPKKLRSELGAYYTPPALCERLLDMATDAGVDWCKARVLDPACGGGAFLSPVARRMVASMGGINSLAALESVEDRLRGIELDPFAAWLSQVFLDATLTDLGVVTDRRPEVTIQVENALEVDQEGEGFDLVVGNPPYGRVGLSPQQRHEFKRSLYGHANLYGLFTDQALRLVRIGGTVAFVTPTSFLSGAYFKALRKLLGQEAPPVSIDFIAKRKGVFEDVLQETALAVYRRGAEPSQGEVRFTSVKPDGSIQTTPPRLFRLPKDPEKPWLIPRSHEQDSLVHQVDRLTHRLSDYGYEVSTGPLVWNRHKAELRATPGEGRLPLIWAESVRPGGIFDFRAEQRDHQPYFQLKPDQEWLVTHAPCVLLQRTTATEQDRRLVATELPTEFDAEHGGVVVENHLNVIRPRNGQPEVPAGVIAALLNSDVVDQVFRCINGSVAVSAYELEALPLPPPETMNQLEELVRCGGSHQAFEPEVVRLYRGITG